MQDLSSGVSGHHQEGAPFRPHALPGQVTGLPGLKPQHSLPARVHGPKMLSLVQDRQGTAAGKNAGPFRSAPGPTGHPHNEGRHHQ